jgi:PAS domain S-box-containing protein
MSPSEPQPADDRFPRLGEIISRVQSRFIHAASPAEVFEPLLTDLLEFTDGQYGFIAEVLADPADGHRFLRIFVLTDVSWDETTRTRFERHRRGEQPIEFHNLATLFGAVVTTGAPVIANDPANDPRRGGLPPGHLALDAFLGVPLQHGGELIGVVGLANRPGGFETALVDFLAPLFASVAAILGAVRLERARRDAETALRASEERLRNTFEMAAVGIAHVAPQGRFLRVNPALCQIFGRSAEELVRMSYADLTLPDDLAFDQAQIGRLLDGELHAYRGQKRYRHADGHVVWVNLSVALVRDAAGAPDYFIAVLEDITGRKRIEQAMLAAQSAERANAAKTQFLSHMSHELRTPLNAVLGFSQLLLLEGADPLTPGQRAKLRHIEDAGAHLLAMIDDVLDLTRIESGGLALSPETVALPDLAREVVAMLGGAAAQAGVAVQVAPSGANGADHLHADHLRVRQVLVNLLGNAIKYNRRGGQATLRWLADADGDVRIEVHDTGPGLTAEQRAHLFEPFNRLGAERSPVQGTGIGLVVTQRLVQLMGGRIEVESRPGTGSCFAVVLPRARHAPGERAAGGGPATPPVAATTAQRTVLYAEDNPMNVELVRELMRLRPGWRLVVARDGREALRLARSEVPDLLLLDMHLGDMTGLDVRRRLGADAALAALPCVALSADAMPGPMKAALQAGFAAYLTKPLDVGSFYACIDRLLGAGTAG